jgi:predicted HicB family RNase H-like nuclease
MSPRREADRQWNLVVDAKLDKAARAAAKEAGLSLSAWLRAVVRKQLGLPTI